MPLSLSQEVDNQLETFWVEHMAAQQQPPEPPAPPAQAYPPAYYPPYQRDQYTPPQVPAQVCWRMMTLVGIEG
jgi:hypothetical protein